PTAATPVIEKAATDLLTRLWEVPAPVRLLGLGVSGLSPVRQLALFDDTAEIEDEPLNAPIQQELPNEHNQAVRLASVNSTHLSQRHQLLHETLTLLEARFGNTIVHLGPKRDHL
ncbi:MAG: hypothetical protein EOO38_19290, partial [Cytophagaceae bacterium]